MLELYRAAGWNLFVANNCSDWNIFQRNLKLDIMHGIHRFHMASPPVEIHQVFMYNTNDREDSPFCPLYTDISR